MIAVPLKAEQPFKWAGPFNPPPGLGSLFDAVHRQAIESVLAPGREKRAEKLSAQRYKR